MSDGSAIAQECAQVDAPLFAGSNHVDAVQVLVGRSARECGAEPLDCVALSDQPSRKLIGKDFRSAGLGVTGATPIENEDPQVQASGEAPVVELLRGSASSN